MQKFDFLIVGAGLFGSVFAHEATKAGKTCLVIDKRDHIGGLCYTKNVDGILVHKYGAHIFNTDDKKIFDYITSFGEFNNFINQPLAISNNMVYNLPFNMNLFSKVFGVYQPAEVKAIIDREIAEYKDMKIDSLETKAISLVGRTIYEMFIKGYSEKQWDKKCTELLPSIIRRIPMRFTYDNNYSRSKYQGIPVKGYSEIIRKMLAGSEVLLNTSYIDLDMSCYEFGKTIYTGSIDELFGYRFGHLEYRSLEYVEIKKDCENYQGNAVINYPDSNVPYMRSIEHKHLSGDTTSKNTIISYEFSVKHTKDNMPVYPIESEINHDMYKSYKHLVDNTPNLYACGRLGGYNYTNMSDTIQNALKLSGELI